MSTQTFIVRARTIIPKQDLQSCIGTQWVVLSQATIEPWGDGDAKLGSSARLPSWQGIASQVAGSDADRELGQTQHASHRI